MEAHAFQLDPAAQRLDVCKCLQCFGHEDPTTAWRASNSETLESVYVGRRRRDSGSLKDLLVKSPAADYHYRSFGSTHGMAVTTGSSDDPVACGPYSRPHGRKARALFGSNDGQHTRSSRLWTK